MNGPIHCHSHSLSFPFTVIPIHCPIQGTSHRTRALECFSVFFFTASKKLTIILCTNVESGLPVVGCCFRTLRLRRIFITKCNKGVVGLHIKNTVAPFLSYQDVIELSPHLRGPVSERPPLSHSFLKPGVGREQIVIYD